MKPKVPSLVVYPNKLLREISKDVTEFDDNLKKLVDVFRSEMVSRRGVGLAGPQLNIQKRIIVIHGEDRKGKSDFQIGMETIIMINPEIIKYSDETWTEYEGCLSIPGIRGRVKRPLSITVKYKDVNNNVFTRPFTWWDARIIQHECDHLVGILFIDKLIPADDLKIKNKLKKLKRMKKAELSRTFRKARKAKKTLKGRNRE